jgi:transformation/transcription domain-associated protein
MGTSIEEDCYKLADAVFNESINKIFGYSPYKLSDLATLISRMRGALTRSKLNERYRKEYTKDFYSKIEVTVLEIATVALKWKTVFENILRSIPYIINLGRISSAMVDFCAHNTSEIQVFGQYVEIKDIYSRFVLIESFEPASLAALKNGNCIKRLEIRGSDGKKYFFGFSSSLSSVYRREDTCSQLSEYLNSEIRGYPELQRRNVNIRSKTLINLTPKVRLMKINQKFVFLDDVLEDYCAKEGKSYSELVFQYMKYIDEINGTKVFFTDGSKEYKGEDIRGRIISDISANLGKIEIDTYSKGNVAPRAESPEPNSVWIDEKSAPSIVISSRDFEVSQDVKHLAFQKMVELLGDELLQEKFKSLSRDSGTYFSYKKRALISFSANSTYSFLFAVSLRTPCRLAFGRSTGKFANLDVFPYLDEHFTYKTNEAVHIRLTPNLQKLWGRVGLEGPFMSVSYHLSKFMNELEHFRDLFFVCLAKEADISKDCDLLDKNYDCVMKRVRKILKRDDRGFDGIVGIINESTEPNNLSKMSPLWYPWF